MGYKIFSFLIYLFVMHIPYGFCKHNASVASLLELDNAILQKETYTRHKEAYIDSLKNELYKTNNSKARLLIYKRLARTYKSYKPDLALNTSREALFLATELKDIQEIYFVKLSIAEIYTRLGMYKEALNNADSINKTILDVTGIIHYFHLYHYTYSLLHESALIPADKAYYKAQISGYKDSLLFYMEPQGIAYDLLLNEKLLDEGKINDAFQLMSHNYELYKNDRSILGALAYKMAQVYKAMDNIEEEKKYLAISAASDLQKGVKSYIALYKLANILYQEGDLSRAYSYIRCALDDATFCNARYRTLEIAEMMPIIVKAYDQQMKKERSHIKTLLIITSVLGIILLIALLFIYWQMKKKSLAKRIIDEMYTQVNDMNKELCRTNNELSESNLVKEAYIASVFNVRSSYIEKMEKYRIELNRKLKVGQIKEAIDLTQSSTFVSDELKEFFRNFDTTFIDIFPGFIDDFNKLLLPNEQIHPKGGDILPPELRIFALIRLGISESSKIATFLHYSPQTVYNYKLKIKNKLAVPKSEFDEAIKKIGG